MMTFPPPSEPEPMEAPQKREPIPAGFFPSVHDVIMADIDFPAGRARKPRRCLVTFVSREGITDVDGRIVRGRWERDEGGWSKRELRLHGPFKLAPARPS